MREYRTPVAVDVPASARLTDTVFERAEHDPGLVVLRRKASLAPSGVTPGGREAAWQDITARQFRDEKIEQLLPCGQSRPGQCQHVMAQPAGQRSDRAEERLSLRARNLQ